MPLDLESSILGESQTTGIKTVLQAIADRAREVQNQPAAEPSTSLPRVIRFPYSRHSSYAELCNLVQAFMPQDVWPCTVDPEEWAREGM
jgi:DNA cross-link repair 1C protein